MEGAISSFPDCRLEIPLTPLVSYQIYSFWSPTGPPEVYYPVWRRQVLGSVLFLAPAAVSTYAVIFWERQFLFLTLHVPTTSISELDNVVKRAQHLWKVHNILQRAQHLWNVHLWHVWEMRREKHAICNMKRTCNAACYPGCKKIANHVGASEAKTSANPSLTVNPYVKQKVGGYRSSLATVDGTMYIWFSNIVGICLKTWWRSMGVLQNMGAKKFTNLQFWLRRLCRDVAKKTTLGFVWKIMGKHGQPNNPIVYHHPSYKNAILVYTTFSDIPKFWTVSWTWRNCFLETWVRQRNQIHRSGGWISEVSTYEHVRHCSWIKNYEDPTKGSELAFLEKKDSTDDAG